MRRIFGLISAVAVSWAACGLEACATEPDEQAGWRSGPMSTTAPSSSRRQWSLPSDLSTDPHSRPVTLMQPYTGRLGYNCDDNATAAPARLPVPPPDILPISATELVGDATDAMQLAANEPARVILEIRDKVGPNLFAGTIFQDTGDKPCAGEQFAKPAKSDPTDQRELLVRCIRELEQSREQSEIAADACDGQCECCNGRCRATTPEAVQALRVASRQLQEVAELLEEQNLYGRADQLREMADGLRQEARAANEALSSEARAD